MDELIRRTTEGQDGGTQYTLVYADDIIIWELAQGNLEVKFHPLLAVCKILDKIPILISVRL
jgi:hypothetical protein